MIKINSTIKVADTNSNSSVQVTIQENRDLVVAGIIGLAVAFSLATVGTCIFYWVVKKIRKQMRVAPGVCANNCNGQCPECHLYAMTMSGMVMPSAPSFSTGSDSSVQHSNREQILADALVRNFIYQCGSQGCAGQLAQHLPFTCTNCGHDQYSLRQCNTNNLGLNNTAQRSSVDIINQLNAHDLFMTRINPPAVSEGNLQGMRRPYTSGQLMGNTELRLGDHQSTRPSLGDHRIGLNAPDYESLSPPPPPYGDP